MHEKRTPQLAQLLALSLEGLFIFVGARRGFGITALIAIGPSTSCSSKHFVSETSKLKWQALTAAFVANT